MQGLNVIKIRARRSIPAFGARLSDVMGLDATVYCNCFETGRLKEPPPCSIVSISPDGSLECRSEDLNTLLAFDQWLLHRACPHPNGILLHRCIGNLAQVGFLRNELGKDGGIFSVLLAKVLYSGAHSGDYLSLEDVRVARSELEHLDDFVCSSEAHQPDVESFRQQMIELTDVALRVAKPISF